MSASAVTCSQGTVIRGPQVYKAHTSSLQAMNQQEADQHLKSQPKKKKKRVSQTEPGRKGHLKHPWGGVGWGFQDHTGWHPAQGTALKLLLSMRNVALRFFPTVVREHLKCLISSCFF